MRYTLLEIVQDVLNDLDADQVNSIDDTIESQQVAQIAKSCFNEMLSNRDWPHLKQLGQLEASGDLSKPTHMKLPSGIKKTEWISYDKRKLGQTKLDFKTIKYLYPDEFLDTVNRRNSDNTNITTVLDYSGTPVLVLNDKPPQYWTSFDDENIVFDAYDKTVDDTLKKNKTQVFFIREVSWLSSDDFIPDLPEEAFAAFVEEVKSTAFLVLKQMPNQKAEMKANRQNRWLSRKAWKAHGGVRYDDYGRKGRR